LIWDENDDSRYPEGARPLGLGAPDDPCLEGDKSQPVRCVDFVNGGICIIDPDSIDARGDINLNGISYEVADAVVLTNYFIVGVSAFVFSVAGQTAASDVNADGATLTVSDLVYLIRVLIGDASPIPKVIPGLQADVTATLSQVGANYAISTYAETRLGAALFTFEYDGVAPEEITLAEGADGMNLRYSVEDGRVRVLIYDDPAGPSGAFIDTGDKSLLNVTMPAGAGELRLVEAEMSDYQGWQVINANVKTAVLPTEFSLAQNYPNPFNPATNIELSLPQKSDWQITVFNMLGQKVRQFEGASEAGIVTVRWNGKDKNGSNVASGLYLYRAKAGAFSATRKMMLLK
jgi:hypothetical protein